MQFYIFCGDDPTKADTEASIAHGGPSNTDLK